MWTKWKARQQVFTLGPSKHTSWPPYMCTGISAAHSVGLSDQLLLCSEIVQSVSESGEPGESPRDKEHNKKGLTVRPLWGTGVTSEAVVSESRFFNLETRMRVSPIQSSTSKRGQEFLTLDLRLRDETEKKSPPISGNETRSRFIIFILRLRDKNENSLDLV